MNKPGGYLFSRVRLPFNYAVSTFFSCVIFFLRTYSNSFYVPYFGLFEMLEELLQKG